MKIKITSRSSGAVLSEYESDNNTMSLTLVRAVKAGADLSGADLSWADLSGADLSWANLSGADLSWAKLYRADLSGANLSGADLSWANLSGANLYRADLSGAKLDGEILNKAPISLLNLRWPVLITDKYMRIGCRRHMHEEWRAFSDKEIRQMTEGALDFWITWKSPLLALCNTFREEVSSDQQTKEESKNEQTSAI